MNQRKLILIILLIAVALLFRWHAAEQSAPDDGNPAHPPAAGTTSGSSRSSPALPRDQTSGATTTPNNAIGQPNPRTQSPPVVEPGSAAAAAPATNAAGTATITISSGDSIPLATPPAPPPTEANRTDTPVVPPGLNRPDTGP